VTTARIPLHDDAARAQIASALTKRLAVDAGAGSGKTTSLVERIVSLVSTERLPMASIAAITFTEAAAAELRSRIRAALDADPEDELLHTASRELDDAAVGTIHSFALRLLSEYWLEAGLPPNIEVLDPAAEYLDFKARWRAFFDALLADPEAGPMLTRGFAAGLRLRQLTGAGRALVEHDDRLTPAVLARLWAERATSANPAISVRPVLEALNRALAHREHCSDSDDLLARHLDSVGIAARRRLEPLEHLDDEAAVVSALASLDRLAESRGQQKNWHVPLEEVRQTCQVAEEARQAVLGSVRQSVAADLAWRLSAWTAESATVRRRSGRFSFQDLLVEAVAMLRGDNGVLDRARARYRCLLIDEFQDTDPLQAELAHLLGATSPTEDEPARLFVVGDPAQSIYRFRRADVARFEATAKRMDERVTLSSNFRSVPRILSFVDRLFECLGSGSEGGVPHRSLVATREADEAAAGPPVAVFGGPHGGSRARDVRSLATGEVAAVARTLVESRWTVGPDDDGPVRPARFRDVAVLLPTRTALAALERAFEAADVPYRLEGATLVWASQDVRDVVSILRAVDDPGDPVAVVGALRTPALACGDDDLLAHKAAGGRWDPRGADRAGAGPDEPVSRALAILADLHERRMWLDVATLVSTIYEQLHVFELALVHRRPRDHWHRLRWLLDQARAFDEAKGGTLADFLEWVETSEEADRWSTSLGPPEHDDNAVRVMTVHGAKGLEFPIVILTGTDSAPANIRPPLLFDNDGVPHLRFSQSFRSAGHDALAGREKELDDAERRRLLYVALTRARDHLVLDLNHKERTKCLAATLHRACAEVGGDIATLEPRPVPPATVPRGAPAPAAPGWWADHARWAQRRRDLVTTRSRQAAWSATALSARAAPVGPAGPPLRSSGSRQDPETQRRIGRAVHDALAKIEFPPDGSLSEEAAGVARSAADAQHLEGAATDTVVVLAARALASPPVRALAGRRHWKELPLAAPLPGGAGVVEGFADLVGETDEGLIVVDFKTSPAFSSAEQYRLQVAAYAYVLRAVTGRPVARVVVCYLGEDGTEEDSLAGEDLDRAIEGLLASAGPTRSAHATQAGQLVLFDAP
jgi:ATP-dependent helicase/nuclease subunit A